MTKENKPKKTIRVGGVKAVIWENDIEVDGEKKTVPSVSVVRSYKDKKGDWKETNSYNLPDLPKLLMAVFQAYQELSVKDDSDKSE